MPQTTRTRKPAAPPTEIPADEVRAVLGDLLNRAGFLRERITITRHGKPIAALVSIADLERLEAVA